MRRAPSCLHEGQPTLVGVDYIAMLRGDIHLLMRTIGWDPIFEYEGKTYAEMEKEEKVSRNRVPGEATC